MLYADLYRYRDLFLNLFRRDLQVRYRGSLLGLAWTFVNPIVLIGVYTLVFSLLWRTFSIPHYPLFVCAGLVVWIFFQSSLQTSCASLLGQASLVQQVRFPRQLLPLSIVATNLVTFAAMLAIVLPLNLALVPETRSTFWAALPLALPLVGLTSGLAILVACATVFFRDVEHLLAAVFLPWFFLTPIFYTFDQLPGVQGHDRIVSVLYWGNFVTPTLQAIRDPLFFGELPRAADVAYACAAAIVALAVGALVFKRADDHLAAQL